MRPTVKLWEICDVISWQSPESKYYNDKGEWLPFFQWKTEFTNKYIWNPRTWTKYTTKESIKNDILMSVRAPVWPVNINWFDKICIWRWLCAIRPSNKIELDYLFNFLLSIQEQLTWNRGSVFASINRSQIENIQIPLPPLETQKAIVAKLDQIFAELDQTKSEIQKNLDNTDELWKSALNQAFQGDWEMKKLGEMAEIWDWLHWTPQYEQLSEYRFINGNNIKWWHINFNSAKYVSESTYNKLKIDFTVWRTVFMSINWTIWNLAFYNNEKIALWKSVCYFNIKYPDLSTEYLYYYLQTNKSKTYYDDNKTWNTIMNLWLKAIREYFIPVPPLSEQEKIVEHLDQVSKEVKELKSQYQSQLDNLEELKKSVLDKAFRWE